LGNNQFEVQGFPETQPDVDKAQPRDGSAEVVVEDELTKGRKIQEEKVVFPVLGPGEDNKKESELKTKKNEDDNQDLVSH
jgi:hypothetical protein